MRYKAKAGEKDRYSFKLTAKASIKCGYHAADLTGLLARNYFAPIVDL